MMRTSRSDTFTLGDDPEVRRLDQTAARVKAREARRGEDFLHELTTGLVSEHALVAVEDSKVGNMARSAKGTIEQPGTGVAQKAGLKTRRKIPASGRFVVSSS